MDRPWVRMFCLALAASPLPAAAQNGDADAFKGKTITIAVGAAPGGLLDLYARPISEFLGKHIPGKPNVIVTYVPGAASKVLARQIASSAPKDGTFIGAVFASVSLEPLFDNAELKGFDPSTLNFLGSAQQDVSVCIFRRDSGVTTLDQFRTMEAPLGVTAPGSITFDFPQMANGLLGTKLRLVKGYPGGAELKLAVERGEVKGMCPVWSTAKTYFPGILNGNTDYVAVVRGDLDNTELMKAGVPAISTLATTKEQRAALELFLAQFQFAAPYILPPGVPENRVRMLRDAFMNTLRDPEFLELAAKRQIDISPMAGDAVQAEVRKMYATPAAAIELLKKSLARGQ